MWCWHGQFLPSNPRANSPHLGADYVGLGGNGPASIPKVDGEIKASANICKPPKT